MKASPSCADRPLLRSSYPQCFSQTGVRVELQKISKLIAEALLIVNGTRAAVPRASWASNNTWTSAGADVAVSMRYGLLAGMGLHLPGVNFQGADLQDQGVARKAVSVPTCMQACRSHKQCYAFTFITAQNKKGQLCWLKGANYKLHDGSNSGATYSGVVRGQARALGAQRP